VVRRGTQEGGRHAPRRRGADLEQVRTRSAHGGARAPCNPTGAAHPRCPERRACFGRFEAGAGPPWARVRRPRAWARVPCGVGPLAHGRPNVAAQCPGAGEKSMSRLCVQLCLDPGPRACINTRATGPSLPVCSQLPLAIASVALLPCVLQFSSVTASHDIGVRATCPPRSLAAPSDRICRPERERLLERKKKKKIKQPTTSIAALTLTRRMQLRVWRTVCRPPLYCHQRRDACITVLAMAGLRPVVRTEHCNRADKTSPCPPKARTPRWLAFALVRPAKAPRRGFLLAVP